MIGHQGETFYEYQARMKREGLYNCGKRYKSSPYQSNTSKSSPVAEAYRKIWSIRQLPVSPVEIYFRNRVQPRGFYNLEQDDRIFQLPSEDQIYGINKEGYHEKSWPSRVGIKEINKVVVPHYFRTFDMQEGYEEIAHKLMINAVFGRLFPTQLAYHIAKMGSFGTLSIDLNNIEGVKSVRLDKYLQEKGIAFDSVKDYLDGIKSKAFSEDLTAGAITQLGLSGYTIPNAVGEQDPNTRNIILLGNSNSSKYDSVARIDFANSSEAENQENNNKRHRVYPFGIYGRYEDENELRENIAKAIVDKDISVEEAQYLLSLHDITKYATRPTAVDNATMDAINDSRFIGKDNVSCYPLTGLFTPDKFEEIASNVTKSSADYSYNVSKYFSQAKGINVDRFQDPSSMISSLEK